MVRGSAPGEVDPRRALSGRRQSVSQSVSPPRPRLPAPLRPPAARHRVLCCAHHPRRQQRLEHRHVARGGPQRAHHLRLHGRGRRGGGGGEAVSRRTDARRASPAAGHPGGGPGWPWQGRPPPGLGSARGRTRTAPPGLGRRTSARGPRGRALFQAGPGPPRRPRGAAPSPTTWTCWRCAGASPSVRCVWRPPAPGPPPPPRSSPTPPRPAAVAPPLRPSRRRRASVRDLDWGSSPLAILGF